MKYYHFHNDISLEISLKSVTTDLTIDASMIKSIQFFTRKNGATYKCCFGNNTLINNGDTVTAVLNNHCLEPGVLQYIVEFQIPDSTYPDFYKKIHQYYATEIELVKGNGETEIADVQTMFGGTIDGKFNDLEAEIDEVSEDVEEISASIVSIQELNSIQDVSINRIEEVIATIDGGTSGSIDRLDTSVNALQSDVSALNSSVNTLTTEQETMSQNLSNVTNTVNDVSTRVDGFESALANKADVSVLGNYYTTGETYTKSEVDRAIADAALDGSLPAGVVVDANYVHTDNNYTTEDKNKVRDFDLTGYPTNSSLVANYATKAELQNVDDNHPTNASVNATYLKKSELAGELSDYPTNSSVSTNYAKKNDVSQFVSIADVSFWVSEEGFITDNDVSQFATERWVNENYCDLENIDEIICNVVDNNYTFQNKVIDVINTSTAVKDIPDLSTNVLNVSTKLDRDYLTAQTINRDFVKNASLNDYVLNSSLSTNYTTKSEFNEVWTTGFLTQDSADELYASKNDVSVYLTDDDVSTFITENDASVYLTDYDFSMHSWGAISLKNTEVVNKHSLGADVSNYMFEPLNFRTLSDYLSDTYTSKQDMSDYLTNNDVSNFVTDNDVSNFVTTDDISTFITENDASIYLTKQEGQVLINHAYQDINLMMGTDLGQITAQGGTVQNYLETYYTSKNDASVYLTRNDASVYATTSYVDTQIGNIQNILSTI